MDELDIFSAALELGTQEERDRYLDEACAGNSGLRERIEVLLRSSAKVSRFMEAPPPGIEGDPTIDQPMAETPGTIIGKYKLLQEIGEGGMGTVFMAEQTEPVQRRVALKIIKPGMDSNQMIARFEVERQALAMMDHPNIARVFDAGTTDSGRPYFVMELVRGIPVTRYCDEHHMAPRERLKLFTSVCLAVHHAHQKGVIHRDLKPSNVLVAHYDSQPVAKVIDFGVAKAAGQRLTEKTLFTQFGQVVGTLEYMSPEQVRFNQRDIDTRSDIYSLGVLLYELLTGTTPFESERLHSAAMDELLRIIRDEQPPKPSTRVSSSNAKASMTAEKCGTEARKLLTLLRGDLDWLIMKSLAKERERRYETAYSFAADIERYLNGDPIEARPPSLAYRARKTAVRHRAALTALAAVMLALITGTATSVRLALLWQEERNVAVAARKDMENLMRRNRNYLIEKALLFAVAGELDKVKEILGGYEEKIDVGDDEWLPTLRGACFVHRAELGNAIHELEPVVEESPDNVAAAGLLAISYLEGGHWEKGIALAHRIKDKKPRAEFKDFDLLFKAYGLYFLDDERSMERFQDIVDRHPAWGTARSYLAHSLGLLAGNKDEMDYLDEAIRQETIARALLVKENAWTLTVRLFLDLKVIQLHKKHGLSSEVSEKARLDGLEAARTFREDYPNNILGNWLAAPFYDEIGEPDTATEIWREVLTSGSSYAYCAIGRLHSDHTSDEMLEIIDELGTDEPMVLAAKAYILADVPERRSEALEIYDRLAGRTSSLFARHWTIQIPLLLGETDDARRQCRKWMEEFRQRSTVDGKESVAGADLSLGLIARLGSENSPHAEGTDLPRQYMREYTLGLLSLSDGDRDGALTHFEACEKVGHVNGGVVWAREFIRRIKEDPEWPRANIKLHPDI